MRQYAAKVHTVHLARAQISILMKKIYMVMYCLMIVYGDCVGFYSNWCRGICNSRGNGFICRLHHHQLHFPLPTRKYPFLWVSDWNRIKSCIMVIFVIKLQQTIVCCMILCMCRRSSSQTIWSILNRKLSLQLSQTNCVKWIKILY